MFFKGVSFILVIVAVLVTVSYSALVAVGYYLTPSDELKRADAIVVLSGDSDRVAWGIKHYQEGWAGKIMFVGAAEDPGSISNAAAMGRQALAAGVAAGAILLEEKSTNTLENAKLSQPILVGIGAKRIILVTSPYHQRRAYETFHHVLGDGVQIVNSPSGYSTWQAESWWEKSNSAHLATSEILKIIWTGLTGEYE